MTLTAPYSHPPPRQDWLGLVREDILEPNQKIYDPHHHIWNLPGNRYLPKELLEDLLSGHRIIGTNFVQCGFSYLNEGPPEFHPVGETVEIMNFIGSGALDLGGTQACNGIVGFADLLLGPGVVPVLQRHREIAGSRFVGIRHSAVRDTHFPNGVVSAPAPAGLLSDPQFRQGFEQLRRFGLTYDAWIYNQQLPELISLARAFPETPIVLDHCGGILGIGYYQGRSVEVYREWLRNMRMLATCPNVHVKVGGLGMITTGLGFEDGRLPPTSVALANSWKPFVDGCIETFGISRCMFESNFPVDKASTSYHVLWNAFKLLVSGATRSEKDQIFFENAMNFYGIGVANAGLKRN